MTKMLRGMIAGAGALAVMSGAAVAAQAAPAIAPTPVTYYQNCTAVRDAGKAPLYRGDDGYDTHLDRDRDGIACE
ncbi:excalibur calcium-binding domain-containing protein [Gordonia sp. CPCC 206044]|uniref:excalibur calcium-binding domain-containing protein n=1 Tax=Gordonia sp. CPCC 206044 TaxID=3140793 RepID=UPI003AF365F6